MDSRLRVLERQAATGDLDAVRAYAKAREQADGFDPDSIVIDDETWEVDHVHEIADGVAEITMGNVEYVVARDEEAAGIAARERWAEMARFDPAEFAEMVGRETLVQWGMGQPAGPGSTQVRSLQEWLDLWLDTPEEEWARYDGQSCDVDRVGTDLADELGFTPTVAYRSN